MKAQMDRPLAILVVRIGQIAPPEIPQRLADPQEAA